jgi:hypothetical protein
MTQVSGGTGGVGKRSVESSIGASSRCVGVCADPARFADNAGWGATVMERHRPPAHDAGEARRLGRACDNRVTQSPF